MIIESLSRLKDHKGLTYKKSGPWLFDKVNFNYRNYTIIYAIYQMDELSDN